MYRSFVLAVGIGLAMAASARADIIYFPNGDGTNPVNGFQGFDYQPGNVLNVGAQTAIANFAATGTPQQFTSFGQANAIVALSNSGDVGIPGISLVFGATESVVGITGTPGAAGASATIAFVPGGPVNYFEIYTGTGNNLTGTGFNAGTRILAGTIDSFTNVPVVTVGTTGTGNLDQFGPDNYPNNDSQPFSGSFRLQGTVTFFDPDYFGFTNPNETFSTFSLDVGVNAPFDKANPSAAFLINSTFSASGETPVTSGAGNGANTGGLYDIGPINGGDPAANGQSNQVQTDGSVVFATQILPGEIPEPASILVFGAVMGVGGLVYRNRRKAQAA